MTPKRWARMKEIFGAALEMPEGERDAYLASSCGQDRELRREIEHLLAKEHNTDLRSPVSGILRTTPAPAKGDMLGRYRIEGKLAEGLAQDADSFLERKRYNHDHQRARAILVHTNFSLHFAK